MQKLTSFALRHTNLNLDVSVKAQFNSGIWLSSNTVKNRPERWLTSEHDYHCIINKPESTEEIKRFERIVESEMAYLKTESHKLTKKGK